MTAGARRAKKKIAPGRKKKGRLRPLSLYPLDFDTAMKGLITIPVEKLTGPENGVNALKIRCSPA